MENNIIVHTKTEVITLEDIDIEKPIIAIDIDLLPSEIRNKFLYK